MCMFWDATWGCGVARRGCLYEIAGRDHDDEMLFGSPIAKVGPCIKLDRARASRRLAITLQ
jgi:hypothetical protein